MIVCVCVCLFACMRVGMSVCASVCLRDNTMLTFIPGAEYGLRMCIKFVM